MKRKMQNSQGRKEKNENDFPEKGIALERREKTGPGLTMTRVLAVDVSRAIYTP